MLNVYICRKKTEMGVKEESGAPKAEYKVLKIGDCKYFAARKVQGKQWIDKIFFHVHWDEFNGQMEITWEPLENIQKIPTLLVAYELQQNEKWMKKHAGDREQLCWRKRPIETFSTFPKNSAKSFEYVPTGKEYVLKIYLDMERDGRTFYLVRFVGSNNRDRQLVRAPYMEYYFPIDVLEYWKRLDK